jgi:tetratricopeptide (TPR) repeat protein
MERLSREHPDDLEAAAFHALALLGIAYGGGGSEAGAPREGLGLRRRMRAGAIAQGVWHREPDHPGAAHYILHAFDDPDHAVLALPAARRYAEIAPAAPHALHMPSHIFLQLGRWPEAVASNEAAWKASRDAGAPDVHSLHWLLYGHLQQERAEDARPLLDTVREVLAATPRDDMRNLAYATLIQATMAATFLVETRRWDEASRILPPQETGAPPQPGLGGGAGGAGGAGGPYQAFAALAQAPAAFGRGLAAAMTGAAETARRQADALETLGRQAAGAPIPAAAAMAPVLEIQAFEIAATASAAAGDSGAAIETMRRATTLEERMPVPPGPPPLIKPSHELFGEILLRAGRREEAAAQFATSLFRHPGRALSLRGAEQAGKR